MNAKVLKAEVLESGRFTWQERCLFWDEAARLRERGATKAQAIAGGAKYAKRPVSSVDVFTQPVSTSGYCDDCEQVVSAAGRAACPCQSQNPRPPMQAGAACPEGGDSPGGVPVSAAAIAAALAERRKTQIAAGVRVDVHLRDGWTDTDTYLAVYVDGDPGDTETQIVVQYDHLQTHPRYRHHPDNVRLREVAQ